MKNSCVYAANARKTIHFLSESVQFGSKRTKVHIILQILQISLPLSVGCSPPPDGAEPQNIEIWCNGSTTDFGSVSPGSSPGISTILYNCYTITMEPPSCQILFDETSSKEALPSKCNTIISSETFQSASRRDGGDFI